MSTVDNVSSTPPELPSPDNVSLGETMIKTELADDKSNHNESEDEYPEGGLQAWATVLGAVLVQFCGLGYSTAYGVFQGHFIHYFALNASPNAHSSSPADYYTRTYLTNASPSAISWIGSVNSFLCIASSLVTGVLYDRGYFYHMLYGGSLLTSFSLVMLSFTQPNHLYQVFLAQGIGLGLGSGLAYLPTVAIVSQYFKRKETLAMIIVVSGASLGAIVHPIMLNKLLAMPQLGFATAVRASAAMVTVLLAIACSLIRERKAPNNDRRVDAVTSGRHQISTVIKASARDPPFVCFCVSLAIFSIGFYYPIFYLQLDAVEHGVGEAFSFYIFAIMNTGCLVGGLLPGILVTPFGEEGVMIGSAIATAASVFAMLGLRDSTSTVVISVIYGIFIGMFFGLQGPIVSLLTLETSTLGTRLGIAFTSCSVGALIGPPIHGALLTDTFDWQRPAMFSGTFSAVGALGFAAVPILRRRKRGVLVTPV